MALTGLDVLVLLAVGIAAFMGLMRGFVGEIMSLAAWLVAIIAVKLLHGSVALVLVGPVGTDTGASVLAFALIFGGTFVVIRLIATGLSRAARTSFLGPFDRLLGLGFGATKGLIVATVVFLFVGLVFDTFNGGATPRPDWMTKSRSYTLLRASSEALVDFVAQRRSA